MADVFSHSNSYIEMLPTRQLIQTLLGGTEAMRKAAEVYLPKEPAEETDAYLSRLNRSTLYNQLHRTLMACMGKVLSKPIIYKDLPGVMEKWIEDIDLEGNHLDRFARDVFFDGAAYGVSFIYVDAPKSETPQELRTLATDRAEGIRPYFVHVKAMNVIGWRHARIGGRQVLTQVRVLEPTVVDDGEFGEKVVERVRVLEIGRWRLFERADKSEEPRLVDEGTNDFPIIPLVPFFTNRTGPMEAMPPLANLAYLNLRHWQSSSDQANILKVVRIPMLAKTSSTGITEDDSDGTMVVGAGAYLELANGEDIKWVEHQGAAINAGRQDLMDLIDQMEKAGFQMTARETSGDVTATETSVNAAEAHSTLQAFALNFQDCLEQALKIMGLRGGVDMTEEPSVIVNKEFGATLTATDMPLILQMKQNGDLTRETLLAEAKRRGLISEDVNIEDEVKALEALEQEAIQTSVTEIVDPQNQ